MAKKKKNGVALFLGLCLLYALVFGGRAWWLKWVRAVRLETGRPAYLHYDFVDVRLWTRDPTLNSRWQASPPRVEVLRDGGAVTTIAGIRELRLAFDPPSGTWTARWPCPWNAPPGEYTLGLRDWPGLSDRLQSRPFRIGRLKPALLPQGFSVLTLETAMPFKTMRVRAPSGEMKDWRGLVDWAEYLGADAFWVLGGQSPGDKPGQVWLEYNLPVIPQLARECRRRGLKFGVYVQCYLTMGKDRLPRYEYAREVRDGRSWPTRAISIRDPKRPGDVAELLKRFRDIPEVDYLGIDYIRNALGGYELAEDFLADMPGVRPPSGWDKLTPEERMVFFARKKIMRRDKEFIDAWQWWRARKIAGVVRAIKAELGDSKPLWAFTLTWEKGWQHGQDPVMMNDAGVDADALMLYEADREQFEALVMDWNRYVKRGDVQLIVGDVIDWPLHQRSPDGPKEFYRRSVRAIDKIYADGPARGVFFHDLGRALWGRLGPWSTREWMDEAKRVIKYFKSVSKSKKLALK